MYNLRLNFNAFCTAFALGGEKLLLHLGIWKLDLQNEGPIYEASGQGRRYLGTAA